MPQLTRLRRIAILCRDRSPGWFAQSVATAAVKRLTAAGCIVHVFSPSTTRLRGIRYLEWLKEHDVDAAIDLGFHLLAKPGQTIRHSPIPIVHTDVPDSGIFGHSVSEDFEESGRLLIDHLLAVGFRSCGYLITSSYVHVKSRFETFMAHAKKAKLWDDRCVIDLRSKLGSGHPSTVELDHFPDLTRMLRDAQKPVAFCCHNDFAAAVLLEWLLQNGFKVPAEVGVVGCDDDPIYSLSSIGLTTLKMPVEEIGRTCAEVILEAIESGQSMKMVCQKIAPSLVIRASTVAPGTGGSWLIEAIETIRANVSSPDLSALLSRQMGVSYGHVARRFRKALGVTVLEYRDKCRLDQAAHLLLQKPKLKVEYICRHVGYTSLGRFSAAFRKHHGVLPKHYQNDLYV